MNSSHLTILNQARQNAVAGNVEKGLALLKKLLETSRNDKEVQATAYFEIGKIYTNINKDDVAVKFFKKAISIEPEVLIQEVDWFQDLKRRNKKHVFDEIERTQSQFRDYLRDKTKDIENNKPGYVPESVESGVSFSPSGSPTKEQRGWAAGSTEPMKFAGFWKRVIATIVDCLIILFSGLILLLILVYGFGLTFTALFAFQPIAGGGVVAEFIGRHMGYLVWCFVFILVLWLYYAIMESSRCQGTLGKMLLGIYLTNQYGKRIGVGQASGRYFLKVLLVLFLPLFFVGCVMVAVTEKKQAWHDMPVGCLVLSK